MSQVDINTLRNQVENRISKIRGKSYKNEFGDWVPYIGPEHSEQLESLRHSKGKGEFSNLTEVMKILTTTEFRAGVQAVFNRLSEQQQEQNPMPEPGIDGEIELLEVFKETISKLPKPDCKFAASESSEKGGVALAEALTR